MPVRSHTASVDATDRTAPTRHLLRLLAGLLPATPLKSAFLRRLGWDVSADSSISVCILWRVEHVVLGPNSRIGAFNVFRDLRRLELGQGSVIGQWNWISAAPELRPLSDDGGSLRIGHHSAITSRHYVDASGGVTVGDHCTVAGVRSTVITHQIDLAASAQTVKPVHIGHYVIVSSDCRIAPGARIASNSLVAMGATVVGDLDERFGVYAGVPARKVREIPRDAKYFRKADVHVRPGC